MDWWWFGSFCWYLLKMSHMIWLEHGTKMGLKSKENKKEGLYPSLGRRCYLEMFSILSTVFLDNRESRGEKQMMQTCFFSR